MNREKCECHDCMQDRRLIKKGDKGDPTDEERQETDAYIKSRLADVTIKKLNEKNQWLQGINVNLNRRVKELEKELGKVKK